VGRGVVELCAWKRGMASLVTVWMGTWEAMLARSVFEHSGIFFLLFSSQTFSGSGLYRDTACPVL
jgi:hypothetical protein